MEAAPFSGRQRKRVPVPRTEERSFKDAGWSAETGLMVFRPRDSKFCTLLGVGGTTM